jgi:hypothetical protein
MVAADLRAATQQDPSEMAARRSAATITNNELSRRFIMLPTQETSSSDAVAYPVNKEFPNS